MVSRDHLTQPLKESDCLQLASNVLKLLGKLKLALLCRIMIVTTRARVVFSPHQNVTAYAHRTVSTHRTQCTEQLVPGSLSKSTL